MAYLGLAALWSSLHLCLAAGAQDALLDSASLIQQETIRRQADDPAAKEVARRVNQAALLPPGVLRRRPLSSHGSALPQLSKPVESKCNLPEPLHYNYGKYEGAYSWATVSWTDEEFLKAEQIGRRGATDQLVPLMRKLQRGETLRMVVMGGSSTAGANCRQGEDLNNQITAKECAWPRRFQHWLQEAFPQGKVELVNFAQGAATSSSLLAGASMMLEAYTSQKTGAGADIIFIDTLVNDVYQPQKQWGHQSGEAQMQNMMSYFGSVNDTYSALAYEQLLRTLHKLQPKAVLFAVLSGCPICKVGVSHRNVTSHYNVPQLDWGDLVDWKTGLWAGSEVHPNYWYHASLADVLAKIWGGVWRDACSAAEARRPPRLDWEQSFFTAEQLEPFAPCLKPLSAYDASIPSTTQEGVHLGDGWSLYEDRPGKPGWISETPGSTMKFDLRFGEHPTMVITWMRSYEKMGNASLILNGKIYPIEGLWTEALNENVSLAYSRWLQVDRDTIQPTADREFGVAGFGIHAWSNKTLRIKIKEGRDPSQSNKMKILQVFTC